MNEDEKLLDILTEISKNTSEVPRLEEKYQELLEWRKNFKEEVLDLIKNNNDLDDEFKKRALKEVQAYLNTDEAREKLENQVKLIVERSDYGKITKILTIFGTLLSIVITAVLTWILK